MLKNMLMLPKPQYSPQPNRRWLGLGVNYILSM